MKLQELKVDMIWDKFQILHVGNDGNILESCNSLFDVSDLIGKNLFEEILLFQSLEPAILEMKADDPPLEIPFVDFEYKELRQNFHFSISRSNPDSGFEGFLVLVEGDKEFQRRLVEMQQQRNETVILLERVEEQQKELNASHQALKKVNTELDRFAYIVSHDLKSPLRGIGSLASWIAEDLKDGMQDEVDNHIVLLKKRVSRMESLIEGVLEYSRVGRQQLEPESFELSALMSEVLDNLAAPAEFSIQIPEKLPKLQSFQTLLFQVFSNLIGNAIKYHHGKDPRIEVDWKLESPGFHRFYVKDNGPGIDPRSHERIFEIFQTLKSKDSYESTGIGLTIVKKIIEEQGGRIWIESEKDKGATFYFTWPEVSVFPQ